MDEDLYVLQVTHYEAPDRGDPNGGWRPLKPVRFSALSDAEALAFARSTVRNQFGPDRDDIRWELLKIVATSEEVAAAQGHNSARS